MTKRKSDVAPRMFTQAIGDKIRQEHEKKLSNTIREHSLTLLEKLGEKTSPARRKLLQTLNESNKKTGESETNINTFISNTINHIVLQFNIMCKKEVLQTIQKDINRAKLLNELAKTKNIAEMSRPYEFYSKFNSSSPNIVFLDWFVNLYSSHVYVIINYDYTDTNEKSNKLELFLTEIQQQLPTLHSRFANLAVEKFKEVEIKNSKEV